MMAANRYHSGLSRTTKAMVGWSLLLYPGDQCASLGATGEVRVIVGHEKRTVSERLSDGVHEGYLEGFLSIAVQHSNV